MIFTSFIKTFYGVIYFKMWYFNYKYNFFKKKNTILRRSILEIRRDFIVNVQFLSRLRIINNVSIACRLNKSGLYYLIIGSVSSSFVAWSWKETAKIDYWKQVTHTSCAYYFRIQVWIVVCFFSFYILLNMLLYQDTSMGKNNFICYLVINFYINPFLVCLVLSVPKFKL